MSADWRIGVDLGGTKIEAVALDPAGRIQARRRVATPAAYEAAVAAAAELVRALEKETGVRARVGFGTPGTVSRLTGRMKNCNSTALNDKPLQADLEAALERPVRIANDADCFALSEAVDGAGLGAAVVFGVIVGTGCGGGIVIDGRPVQGPNGIAGEWGHNPLPWPTPADQPTPHCYCGRRGCLETYVSGPGLSADHRRHTGEMLDAVALAGRAADGDASARASLRRHAGRMARGLASVINILDPDVIVLGGGIANIASLYETVPRLWGRYVFSDRVDTRLLPPRHGDSSGVRGAAWLW